MIGHFGKIFTAKVKTMIISSDPLPIPFIFCCFSIILLQESSLTQKRNNSISYLGEKCQRYHNVQFVQSILCGQFICHQQQLMCYHTQSFSCKPFMCYHTCVPPRDWSSRKIHLLPEFRRKIRKYLPRNIDQRSDISKGGAAKDGTINII